MMQQGFTVTKKPSSDIVYKLCKSKEYVCCMTIYLVKDTKCPAPSVTAACVPVTGLNYRS
jgi:hypothetical protein